MPSSKGFVGLTSTVGVLLGVSFSLLMSGCTSGLSRRPAPLGSVPPSPHPQSGQIGVASWYGPGFHGQPTASGEIYDQNALTAAHRTLPLGTRVQVTNLANGKSVQVRITDRGPFVRGRKIDLSRGAARKLGMTRAGLSKVRIQPLPASRSRSRTTVAQTSQTRVSRKARRVQPASPQKSPLDKLLAGSWPF